MATKKCIVCNTIMENVRSDKIYCSRNCQNKAHYQNKNQSRIKICEYCGNEFEPKKFGMSRRYCFSCMPTIGSNGALVRKYIKQLAVKYKRKKCEVCGYHKSLAALEFHHKNPKEKDFFLSDRNLTLSWGEIQKELDKCVLLCANCHREEHEKEGR